MRPMSGLLLGILACGGTEPDYPPFDGPAPTVSDFVVINGEASAILRTWIRVDNLTWRVTIPDLVQDWSASAWHVADDDSNVQGYQCADGDVCEAFEEPV